MLSIALLEKSLQTEIYPRGGAYIYIDVLPEEALPPALGTRRRPWGHQQQIKLVNPVVRSLLQCIMVNCGRSRKLHFCQEFFLYFILKLFVIGFSIDLLSKSIQFHSKFSS